MHRPIEPHLWQFRPIQDIFYFILLIFLFYLITVYWNSFMPIFVAIMFAYILNPILRTMKTRWNWPRPLTAAMLITAIILFLIAFVVWIWPLASEQLTSLAEKAPDYIKQIAAINNIDLSQVDANLAKWLKRIENPTSLLQEIAARSGKALNLASRAIGTTSYVLFMSFLIPFYFFFFAWHFDDALAYLSRFIPNSHRLLTLKILYKMDTAVAQYFHGRVFVSLIIIIPYSVGWWLAEVPFWFLLGMLAGLFNIIPFASAIFWPIAILLKYIDYASGNGDGGFLAILVWPSVVYLVAQFIEGWILSPWVQSDQLKMSVVTVIIAVFVGGEIGGLVGLLLAVPVVACLKIFLEDVVLQRLERWAQTE